MTTDPAHSRDSDAPSGRPRPGDRTCALEIQGPVATISITPPRELTPQAGDLHWDIGELFIELRSNSSVRVVVLTGMGSEFYVPREASYYSSPAAAGYRSSPEGAWRMFTGILKTHQAMAEIEKPIVAKVNGDALGFGSSLAFAADLIVARDDAKFVDIHLGMGEHPNGPTFGLVPGDGGAALVPLFMSPAVAKEYLMLARAYTGAALVEIGAINYAVKAEDLDAAVDDIVARLLARSAYALAWTKRTVNRRVANSLNMNLDASAAYEMVNFLQLDKLGGNDPMKLE